MFYSIQYNSAVCLPVSMIYFTRRQLHSGKFSWRTETDRQISLKIDLISKLLLIITLSCHPLEVRPAEINQTTKAPAIICYFPPCFYFEYRLLRIDKTLPCVSDCQGWSPP